MGNLLLPTVLLKAFSIIVIVPTIIFSIHLGFVSTDISFKEEWFCYFKSIGYTLLAVLIYWYYIKLDKVPILDLFTFMLAAFEGGHNFVNSFGLFIASIVKVIFRIDK